MTRIEVARSPQEIRALQPVWAELQSPFVTSDPDFVLTYIENTESAVRPHVVVLHGDAARRASPAAASKTFPFRSSWARRPSYAPAVRALTVTYGGFMGRTDESTITRLLAAVMGSVEPGEVDLSACAC